MYPLSVRTWRTVPTLDEVNEFISISDRHPYSSLRLWRSVCAGDQYDFAHRVPVALSLERDVVSLNCISRFMCIFRITMPTYYHSRDWWASFNLPQQRSQSLGGPFNRSCQKIHCTSGFYFPTIILRIAADPYLDQLFVDGPQRNRPIAPLKSPPNESKHSNSSLFLLTPLKIPLQNMIPPYCRISWWLLGCISTRGF